MKSFLISKQLTQIHTSYSRLKKSTAISSVYHCNMWWKLFFLIVATAAASDDEYEAKKCGSLIDEQCVIEEGSPTGLLSTERDLEEYCKFATEYFGCIERILDNCKENEEEPSTYLAYLRDVVTNNKRICDKDSLLYSALDESFPCLVENKDKLYTCSGLEEENIEPFKDTLARIGITKVADPNYEPQLCLDFLFYFGCFSAKAGKLCGDVTKDVVIDVMQGFDISLEGCLPGMEENFHVIANAMQLEMEKEEAVENKIKKKK